MVTVDELAAALRRFRFRFNSERELHEGISRCLDSLGISYSYEHSISPTDRPDFLVGTVAIEAKVDGSLADLTRQVHRYAKSDRVQAIVVVSSKARHRMLPPEISGKPLRVVPLVAL